MTFPPELSSSKLYRVLAQDADLLASVGNLRRTSEQLAETIARDAPGFTDHSIRHMDALWSIAERILTNEEIQALSPAEAFLLASGFYLHDIGMAYAATEEGRQRLEASPEYLAVLKSTTSTQIDPSLRAQALAAAIRAKHAAVAIELATSAIPGTTQFLIEPINIRDQFGLTCGRIAASHHWSVDRLDTELGNQDRVPLAGGRSADLGFVAAALRLIDYAHINRERAAALTRSLRPNVGEESSKHWDAQQDIDGPERTGDELVYRSAKELQNVDAWWLYYEMLRGLDNEIRQVRSFLQKRAVSSGRLSLIGVRGAGSPDQAAKFIETSGFLPLEIGVRASSITRLVKLLAGESLYGRNFMAPVRELVQNAVDAVLLKKAVAKSPAETAVAGLPISVSLIKEKGALVLSVRDWGIGMSQRIITDHLLTIASDYWEVQYFSDFPGGAKSFTPTGRFGIGFLSVFMLGEEIWVSTERSGDSRYQLSIHGLGRRAELRKEANDGNSGSEVKVTLKENAGSNLKELHSLCRCYFPLLPVLLEITTPEGKLTLEESWLLSVSVEELRNWAMETSQTLLRADRNGEDREDREDIHSYRLMLNYRGGSGKFEPFWITDAPEYTEPGVRLVADRSGVSILCLRGFALQSVRTPGFTGVINSETVTPDASRRRGIDVELDPILQRARLAILPRVSTGLNALGEQGFSANRLELLSWCCQSYGPESILGSTFRFIQLVESDGSSRFVSSKEFGDVVSSMSSVFVALKVGPNSLLKNWHSRLGEWPDSKLGICFSGNERISIPYLSRDETKTGSLDELWSKHDDAPLFSLFVSVLEKTWGVEPGSLISQDGWIHEQSELYGFFRRA
jgi:hypothetical protein